MKDSEEPEEGWWTLSSASVARVWRYINLIITIITITVSGGVVRFSL